MFQDQNEDPELSQIQDYSQFLNTLRVQGDKSKMSRLQENMTKTSLDND